MKLFLLGLELWTLGLLLIVLFGTLGWPEFLVIIPAAITAGGLITQIASIWKYFPPGFDPTKWF